jgi:DoxX-like family
VEVVMNIALWTAQLLVAAVFAFSAVTKGTWSKERLLANGQTGVAPVPLALLRGIALSELLGVLGLIVPWWTGIAPVLTPLAAAGLGVIMVGAATVHLRLKEPGTALQNLLVLTLCVFVVVGRVVQL